MLEHLHFDGGTPSRANVKARKAAKSHAPREKSKVRASDGTVYEILATGQFRVCDSRGRPSRRLTNQEKKAYKRGRVKRLKEMQHEQHDD